MNLTLYVLIICIYMCVCVFIHTHPHVDICNTCVILNFTDEETEGC